MAFTNKTCRESGTWSGYCGHGEIVVRAGQRFPECPGCKRGIDWHRVGPASPVRRGDPRPGDDGWVNEGWWPEKGR